jgi:hypothetical protein
VIETFQFFKNILSLKHTSRTIYVMKLVIDPIEIDVTQTYEVDIASWYDKNRDLTKKILFLGSHIIREGIASYSSQENATIAAEVEAIKKRHAEDMAQAKAKHARVISDTTNMYEETIQQLKKSVNIEQLLDSINQRHSFELEQERVKYTSLLDEARSTYENNLALIKQSVNKDDIKSMMEKEYEAKLTMSNLQTQQKYAKELADLKDKWQSENMSKTVELEKFRLLYHDVQSKHEQLMKTIVEDGQMRDMDDLKRQLNERDKELNILKKATFAKGNKGEYVIKHRLQQLYPCNEFVDVSKDKHCGDIHMIPSQTNDIIMIESKYKETISKQDVDKFYADIEHISKTNGRIVCAVFVSILTKNIPNIGSFKIDFHNGVPAVFVGFSSEDEFDSWIHCHMNMALELAAYQKKGAASTECIQDIMKRISPLVEQIRCIKTSVEKIRNIHMNTMNVAIIDLENSIKKLYHSIQDIISNDSANEDETNQQEIKCPECGLAFASRKALGSHSKVHKKKLNE